VLLARALAEGRSRYNARFAVAKTTFPALDGAAFGAFVVEVLSPIVATTADAAPADATRVLDGLYDAALELVGRGLAGAGARYPVIVTGWQRILPRAPRLLAEDAQAFAAIVTNGLFQLCGTGARPVDWLVLMEAAAPLAASIAELRDAGLVAAWRAGLAYARPAALAAAARLPGALGSAALAIDAPPTDDGWRALVARLLGNPWANPGHAGTAQATVRVGAFGNFRGFGGPFVSPPRVSRDAGSGALVAEDARGAFLLHADVFGVLAQLHAGALRPAPNGDMTLEADGVVRVADARVQFPELRGVSSWASTDRTLAVTLAHSHRVFLFASSGG
jgi:hypothetical protein